MRNSLELSRQTLPSAGGEDLAGTGLAPSRPLYELEAAAPQLPEDARTTYLTYAFANDESAGYFQQIAVRAATGEYQAAGNRTALLIGESSLAAALSYIPEDTIILLDTRPEFCSYMRHYIDALRHAPDVETCQLQIMRAIDPSFEGGLEEFQDRPELGFLDRQIGQWNAAGLAHPLSDADAFKRSQRLARDKAIIPWHANIEDEEAMRRLAEELKRHDANITMANLTNAINWPVLNSRNQQPNFLAYLPLTEHAPILTTSVVALPPGHDIPEERAAKAMYVSMATGPFFGLGNLFAEGGDGSVQGLKDKAKKAVFTRQYPE